MEDHPRSNEPPRLVPVSRRRFLKLAAAGAGAAALTVAGVSLIPTGGRSDSLKPEDVPVRNPAFRETRGEADGHVVLYCRRPGGEYLAYDLNPAGHSIWRSCLAHVEADKAAPRTVAQIAARLGDRLDPHETTEFIALMRDKGLVSVGLAERRAYFVYEGKG